MRFSAIALTLLAASGAAFVPTAAQAQRADLSGLTFVIDPGHGGTDNKGWPRNAGWSEAQKALRVSLHLQQMLQASGAQVTLTRTVDGPSLGPTLGDRARLANSLNANWFHSIHSNAAGETANHTLLLMSEGSGWTTDPSRKYGTLRFPQTLSLSEEMAANLARAYRVPNQGAYGDATFARRFGVDYINGLGVLNPLRADIPGELSEGGFHTNRQQNLLNMNPESQRVEARVIWLAFMHKYNAVVAPLNTLMGVVSDLDGAGPINGATARIGDRTYTTDTYATRFSPYCLPSDNCANGFYYFEGLADGPTAVTFSAPGYADSTITVPSLDSGFFTFRDMQLLSTLPATLTRLTVAEGDTAVSVATSFTFNFSRKMNRASVQSAFRLVLDDGSETAVPGTFSWSGNDQVMLFRPAELLAFATAYRLELGLGPKDFRNRPLDTNNDGQVTAADALVRHFRATSRDLIPPVVKKATPRNLEADVPLADALVNLTFDELLDPASLTADNFRLTYNDVAVPTILTAAEANGRTGVTLVPQVPFLPNGFYKLAVGRVRDRSGNQTTQDALSFFTTAAQPAGTFTVVSPIEPALDGWAAATFSGSNLNLVADSTVRSFAPTVGLPGTTGSMKLQYGFSLPTGGPWLLREYFDGAAQGDRRFEASKGDILQTYVRGDGSGTLFRFAAVDDLPETGASPRAKQIEVSSWLPIDWIGWRLVQWKLGSDPAGNWAGLGDGVFTGFQRFDSFQLSYAGTGTGFGTVYFDDLRVTRPGLVTAVGDDTPGRPAAFALAQNTPNPFNPTTAISYQLSAVSNVRLDVFDALGRKVRTLVDGPQSAGAHTVTFDGNGLASGLYLYRLTASGQTLARRMTLIR